MFPLFTLHFLKELCLTFFWTVWATSLMKQGYTLGEASYALGFFFFASAMFELPTGFFADYYGRRLSTLVGLGLVATGFFLIGALSGQWGKWSSFFIAGVGFTFVSGASVAWFLDFLKTGARQHNLEKAFFELDLLGRFASMVGAALSVWLLNIGSFFLWGVAGSAALCAMLIGLMIRTPSRPDNFTAEVRLQKADLRIQIKASLFRPVLTALILGGLFLGIEGGVRNIVFQPFVLNFNDGNPNSLAFFQIAVSLVRTAGILVYRFLLIERISRLTGTMIAWFSLMLFAFAEYFASIAHSYYLFLSIYLPAIFFVAWYFPIREAELNRALTDRVRATLLSLDSMVGKLAITLSCILVGSFIDSTNVQVWWQLGAFGLFFSALFFWKSQRTPITVTDLS